MTTPTTPTTPTTDRAGASGDTGRHRRHENSWVARISDPGPRLSGPDTQEAKEQRE